MLVGAEGIEQDIAGPTPLVVSKPFVPRLDDDDLQIITSTAMKSWHGHDLSII